MFMFESHKLLIIIAPHFNLHCVQYIRSKIDVTNEQIWVVPL